MDNLHSFFIVVFVLAAIFVPQVLAVFYATPRNPEIDQHEFDYR